MWDDSLALYDGGSSKQIRFVNSKNGEVTNKIRMRGRVKCFEQISNDLCVVGGYGFPSKEI